MQVQDTMKQPDFEDKASILFVFRVISTSPFFFQNSLFIFRMSFFSCLTFLNNESEKFSLHNDHCLKV